MSPLTEEQAAVVCAYSGILCGSMAAFHQYAERKLDRPIFTHEFASDSTWAELKEASRADFLSICAGAVSLQEEA